MPVPKKKTSKSRRDKRRSHHALTAKGVHTCPQCGSNVQFHHVCQSCGFYKDKEVVEIPLAV
ncbi:MAG: 50S ribosomal protein L32 [Bdellovibrionota bacterium]